MRNRIEAMIILVTFGATAGAHLAIVPALVAFELSTNSTIAFWVYVFSFVPCTLTAVISFVKIAAYAAEMLDDKSEWVTITTESGTKKKVHIVPSCKKGGKPDHELEQLFRDSYQ